MAVTADLWDRIDLAGAWDLAFDPAGHGLADGWAVGAWPEDQAETVQVPALWDQTHPDAEGIGFYRKVFPVPSEWMQRVLSLRFGGASYRTDVWLNGQYLGSHEGSYTPFSFDATAVARTGDDNELVVRVAGLSKHQDVDGQPLLQAPISKQHWFYTESGLWGDVLLEAIPVLSFHDAVIQPDVRNEKSVALLARLGMELGPVVQLSTKPAQLAFLTRERYAAARPLQ